MLLLNSMIVLSTAPDTVGTNKCWIWNIPDLFWIRLLYSKMSILVFCQGYLKTWKMFFKILEFLICETVILIISGLWGLNEWIIYICAWHIARVQYMLTDAIINIIWNGEIYILENLALEIKQRVLLYNINHTSWIYNKHDI